MSAVSSFNQYSPIRNRDSCDAQKIEDGQIYLFLIVFNALPGFGIATSIALCHDCVDNIIKEIRKGKGNENQGNREESDSSDRPSC